MNRYSFIVLNTKEIYEKKETDEGQAGRMGFRSRAASSEMHSFVYPLDMIADGMVTPQTFLEHPHRHRQRLINVIIDDHF